MICSFFASQRGDCSVVCWRLALSGKSCWVLVCLPQNIDVVRFRTLFISGACELTLHCSEPVVHDREKHITAFIAQLPGARTRRM